MTKDEALRLALDAMEDCQLSKTNAAIQACEEALAQPEPVGWAFLDVEYGHITWTTKRPDDEIHTIPMYVGPQTSDPEIPEGWERRTVVGFDALVEALDYAERKGFMPDYITSAWEGFNYLSAEKHTPPTTQHTWVGLTEEDLKPICDEWRIVYGAWMDDFARDIESKLKEKNHGN